MAPDWLNVFHHNPPSRELAEKLFCNRARELRTGIAKLKGCPPTDSMLAVYGPTRSGKSHFVQVLLLKLEKQEPRYQQVTVNANNLGSARRALIEVFRSLLKPLRERKNVPARQQTEHAAAVAKHLDRLDRATGVYAERAEEENSGESSQEERSTEAKIGGDPVPGASVSLTARRGSRTEQRRGQSTRTTVKPPGDAELVDMICELLSDLERFDADHRTLLFIDDIDLLDREGREGAQASQEFLDHLRPIASHPRAAVLVTLREAVFCERDKDFQPLVEIGFMEGDSLREIYQRHVDVYLDGRGVLADDVLDALIATADGRVGVFLRECQGLVTHDLPTDGGALTREDLRGFFRHRIRQWKQSPETMHLVVAIERAVERGELQVVLPEKLGDNPLRFVVLSPIPGDERGYTINPAWADALRPQTNPR
ncbi:MAG: hypothetical protein R3A52_02740 [Polyangiales bacterium]